MRDMKASTFVGFLAIVVVVLSLQQGGLSSEQASAASGGPEMALTVTQDGFCVASDCYAGTGATFKLGVEIVEAPAAGYMMMQTFVDFGTNLTYDDSADAEDEVPWPHPNGFVVRNVDFFGPGTVGHGGVTSFFPPLDTSTYEGLAVEFELACPASPTQETISLLPYDDPVARTYGAQFLEADPPQYTRTTPKVDSITLHCIDQQAHPGDTDGDGCSDARESGADPALGGDRDWLNPWDFYDVAIAGGVPGTDGVIDLPNDYMGVSAHYAPTGGSPYDVHYDRGQASGSSWKDTAGPDGVIDLANDILGVVQQLGHTCV